MQKEVKEGVVKILLCCAVAATPTGKMLLKLLDARRGDRVVIEWIPPGKELMSLLLDLCNCSSDSLTLPMVSREA